jgi:hypothetical protein
LRQRLKGADDLAQGFGRLAALLPAHAHYENEAAPLRSLTSFQYVMFAGFTITGPSLRPFIVSWNGLPPAALN